MTDPDENDFFRSLNNGRKKFKKQKTDMKQPKTHINPIVPFANTSPMPMWEEPVPNIDVVMNGNWPEWEWMGEIFRPYYAGSLWLNRTASHVYWAYMDRDEYTITSVKPLEVKSDADGKLFVETYIKGAKTTTYLDDALKTCFQTSLQTVQVSSPALRM